MKQISIALNVVLSGFILFMACNSSKKSTRADSIPSSHTTLVHPFNSCYDCSDDAFFGLTKKELLDGISRYEKTHWELINNDKKRPPVGPDSRACWYSLDTLKKFICLIENYASGFKIPSSELGIDFYYAVYGNKESIWEPSYKSLMTLFMVPTYKRLDFDPRSSLLLNGIQTFDSISDASEPLVLDGSTANSDIPGLAKNQGQLCPPRCNIFTVISEAKKENPDGKTYEK